MSKSKNVTSVYYPNVDLPGITKTEKSQMVKNISENQYSISLAYPYINSDSTRKSILTHHKEGRRCFINIRLEKIPKDSTALPEVENFPYKVCDISVETDAPRFAKLVDSSKLENYVKNYDTDLSIAVIIWTKEPSTCYTVLIMQPWKTFV